MLHRIGEKVVEVVNKILTNRPRLSEKMIVFSSSLFLDR